MALGFVIPDAAMPSAHRRLDEPAPALRERRRRVAPGVRMADTDGPARGLARYATQDVLR